MRILVVHQHYLLPGDPGGSRFNEFARLWQKAGHDVTVICGTLNYSTGQTPPELRGRWVRRREEAGVPVWRCHVPPAYGRSYLGRMWAFFCFALSSATAVLRSGPADVVIATSPPLTVALTGWLAGRWHRAPWVFEIRDLWPESAITTGTVRAGSLLAGLLHRVECFACARSARIVVLTPAFVEDLVARRLRRREDISLVPNGADLDTFVPGPRENEVRRRFEWGDRFVALYAGAHGRANAPMQLVAAAEHLRDRPDILIVTVGDGSERAECEAAASARGLSNIAFLGAQPKTAMPAFVNAADTGIAVLQDNATFRTVYPNKVFDYMACERPTVLAIDGVARSLVCEEAQAGVYTPPEDAAALAGALRRLADDRDLARTLGRNGRAWAIAHASRASLAARYLQILWALRRDGHCGQV